LAIIKPFRALRPVVALAEAVACAPYDVVCETEVREFIRAHPDSFLRVTRPEAEFAENANVSAAEIFARARQNLEKFIDEKLFARDAEPCVYVYRLEGETHRQTGVVACCSLDEYERGAIKKHEKTRPDKVKDRTNHMVAVRAQTGLIFLAFRNTETVTSLIFEATRGKPIYDFRCAENIKQIVWRITLTDDFVAAFANEVPALYIADGHHRIESALLARDILRDKNAEHTGAEDYNFVLAGMFPAEDLQILAYNRIVKDLNGLSEAEFFERLRENFAVAETTEKQPPRKGEFCMYINKNWYKLRFNDNSFQESNLIELLDASLLQNYVLKLILGIDDERTDTRIGFIGGKGSVTELEKSVDEGASRVAFSMFPTTMDELLAISDADEIMPPKSTWFEPKLRDGLLVHLLED
jgi:uncharacterized protein (DUF1015 family)